MSIRQEAETALYTTEQTLAQPTFFRNLSVFFAQVDDDPLLPAGDGACHGGLAEPAEAVVIGIEGGAGAAHPVLIENAVVLDKQRSGAVIGGGAPEHIAGAEPAGLPGQVGLGIHAAGEHLAGKMLRLAPAAEQHHIDLPLRAFEGMGLLKLHIDGEQLLHSDQPPLRFWGEFSTGSIARMAGAWQVGCGGPVPSFPPDPLSGHGGTLDDRFLYAASGREPAAATNAYGFLVMAGA